MLRNLNGNTLKVDQLYTSPTLFNNFLWAAIATTNDSIWLGEYSICQSRSEVKFVSYPRNLPLANNWPDKHSIEVLQWFSQGKYFVMPEGDTLKFYNTKWGRGDFRQAEADKALPFYMILYPTNGGYTASNYQAGFKKGELKAALAALWRRMWTADNW